MTDEPFTRRAALFGAAGAGGLLLAGCDKVAENPQVLGALGAAETVNYRLQRLLMGRALAREYKPADISKVFKVNGTSDPGTDEYERLKDGGFADYRLTIGGLVTRPLSLSLADLKKLPARTQITRHDCVEGWSCIGQWTGVPVGLLLKSAGLATTARYAVFHCFDDLDNSTDGSGLYYESIDLIDAFHPQTILAYAMNGADLTVGHGAPLRLRLERQLGYKMAKYVKAIQVVDSFAHLAAGKGGYWEDRGYAWYAGI